MRATWVAAVLVTLGLTACGGPDSSQATDDPTDPPTTSSPKPSEPVKTPSEGEACPYLTIQQVSAALGDAVVETAGSVHACFFDPESGSGPSVMLSRVNVQIDPVDYAAQTKALCQGEVTDIEAGDEAFACVMGLGPQGEVYTGKVLVTVNVNGAADNARGIAVAAELLPEVTVPPES
jgi:hypothetical protein